MGNKIFKEVFELEGMHIVDEIKFEKCIRSSFVEFNKKYNVDKIKIINKKKVEVFLIKK